MESEKGSWKSKNIYKLPSVGFNVSFRRCTHKDQNHSTLLSAAVEKLMFLICFFFRYNDAVVACEQSRLGPGTPTKGHRNVKGKRPQVIFEASVFCSQEPVLFLFFYTLHEK